MSLDFQLPVVALAFPVLQLFWHVPGRFFQTTLNVCFLRTELPWNRLEPQLPTNYSFQKQITTIKKQTTSGSC